MNFAGAWGVPNKQSERPEGTERWKEISVKDIPFHCLPRLSRIRGEFLKKELKKAVYDVKWLINQ